VPGTIISDQVVIDAAEATTAWLSLGTWGATFAASGDIYLEGAAALNARASAAAGPVERLAWALAATASGLDLTISERHLYFWVKCFSLPALNTRAKGGIRICISADVTPTATGTTTWDGPTNSKSWFITGKDFEPLSGWACYVIDATSVADLELGTATMSSVDRAGIGTDALLVVGGGSVKPLPVIWDKIAYATGLTITLGTAGAPVRFTDVFATDSLNSNQFGMLTQQGGIYFLAGKLKFGTTGQGAVTVFSDTSQVLVWQDFRVASGFYEWVLNGAASFATTVTLGSISGALTSNGCVIRGSGLDTRRLIAPVIVAGGTGYTAADILTVTGGTGSVVAQFKVITVSSGVITNIKMETAGSYSVPPTGTLAVTGGTGADATFTATVAGGSIWKLTASAANQTLNLYACILSEMLSAALASTTVIDGCTIQNSGEITASGATIKNCTFQNLRTTTPISATYQIRVTASTPILTGNKYVNCATALLWDRAADTNGKLDGSTFISGGTGHAIEFGTNTPGDPTEISLTDVTFTSYGADETTNAAIYNNSGKHLIINILGTGNSPTVRNAGGSSTTVVAGTVTTTVTVKALVGGAAISGARVLVIASDNTGPMPFDETVTITRSGATATVAHATHGLVNGKKVQIKGALQPEYNGVFTITVTGASEYTYAVSGTPVTPATGSIKATGVVIDGTTNGSGVISDVRTHASDQPIKGVARQMTASPFYKNGAISGIIDSADGFATTVQLVLDE